MISELDEFDDGANKMSEIGSNKGSNNPSIADKRRALFGLGGGSQGT
jgi:hypothetical protein